MTVQTLLVLLAAVLSAAFILRSLLRASCASGCGSCGSRTCPSKKLQHLADGKR